MGRSSELAQGALVEALRQVFKRKKLTYADAAHSLGVSEQTIKRFFAGDDFPMSRLLTLCELADISFFDLSELARQGEGEISFQLTPEQEDFFADHPHYLLFFNELRGEKSADAVAAEYGLSKRSVARYLKQLEDMKLLERGEGTRVKLLVSGGLNLRKGGSLSRWMSMDFATKMLEWLAAHTADTDPAKTKFWTMSDGLLSPATVAEMKRDVEDLAARYRKISQRETALLPKEKLQSVTWLLALAAPYEHVFRERIIDL